MSTGLLDRPTTDDTSTTDDKLVHIVCDDCFPLYKTHPSKTICDISVAPSGITDQDVNCPMCLDFERYHYGTSCHVKRQQ